MLFQKLLMTVKWGQLLIFNKILCADKTLSPLEIWCNESQERYILAINPKDLDIFEKICLSENCPFSSIGFATNDKRLVLKDDNSETFIDLPMDLLFGEKGEQQISVNSSVINEA